MPDDRRQLGAIGRRLLPHLIAVLVFGMAAALVYGPVWLAGADAKVPVRPSLEPGLKQATRADVTFETWLVARHARTLVTAPQRLFDTEHCAPAKRTLALGIPMIALGVLAIPAFAITSDPVLTWNIVLVTLTCVGALAMYWLVVSWSGVPGAGIVAGLLYAFHPIRLTDISHPSVWDGTWTVFALLFAERLFARGRWRDAAGLVTATTLQVAASFYSLLAATLLTPPVLLWLVLRNRFRQLSAAKVAFVLGCVALAAALLLGPYLFAETSVSVGGLHRKRFTYAALARFAPGAWLFPGFSTLVLAGFALVAPRDRILARIAGDPRWFLVVGAALAAWVALGYHARPLLPNAHALLSAFLPGLDAVRVVLRVFSGTHLALALLAGLGAAGLVRLAGRAGVVVAALLVLLCGFEMLRAPSLGFKRQYLWFLEDVRPDPEEIAFFQELERRGNTGPLLELPLDQLGMRIWEGPPRIMLTLFHRRRTSACFGSYPPAGREALDAAARRLPAPKAIAEIRGQGFTTLIFRHGKAQPRAFPLMDRVGRAAEAGRGIELVYSTLTETAFALRAPTP